METIKVGILGGGQLARMLCEAAYRLGLHPIVLADTPDDPAAQVCRDAIFGGWGDPIALHRLLSQTRVVAFENEFVDVERIRAACEPLKECAPRFAPSLDTIYELQDKLRQKKVLKELQIPSARYELLEEDAKPPEWASKAGCVLKWARLGYDGKGTLILPKWDERAAREFRSAARKKGVPVYVEEKIDFRRELSIVASFSTTGEFAALPLVVSKQQGGICKLVTGPATLLGVEERLEKQAVAFARVLANRVQLNGTFAIEMFETSKGELAVNEIAPRVHNTGHFSQDCADTSQFENHWRALLGLPLGSTHVARPFAMLNLLGPEGIEAQPARVMPTPVAGVHLHWYGKAELRAGRKMGHLNACGAEVSELVRELEACENQWISDQGSPKGGPRSKGSS